MESPQNSNMTVDRHRKDKSQLHMGKQKTHRVLCEVSLFGFSRGGREATTQLPNKWTWRLYSELWMPNLSLAHFLPTFLNLNYPIYLFPLGFYLSYVCISSSPSYSVTGWVAGPRWPPPPCPCFSFCLFSFSPSPAYPCSCLTTGQSALIRTGKESQFYRVKQYSINKSITS